MNKILLFSILTITAAFAQQPNFELADVHVSATVHSFFFGHSNLAGVLSEGRYINRDATMLNLIAAAYGVAEDNIVGGPGWLTSDLFDVIAKVPEGTRPATANLMLRSLLAERFGLTVHQGTRPVPGYFLSVEKSGRKLESASGSETPVCLPKQQDAAEGLNHQRSIPAAFHLACRNITVADFVQYLHQFANGYLDHDVIDATNLEGAWNFDLVWTDSPALATKGSGGISIFDAVEKQALSRNLTGPAPAWML